jgi:hypothetical protein
MMSLGKRTRSGNERKAKVPTDEVLDLPGKRELPQMELVFGPSRETRSCPIQNCEAARAKRCHCEAPLRRS